MTRVKHISIITAQTATIYHQALFLSGHADSEQLQMMSLVQFSCVLLHKLSCKCCELRQLQHQRLAKQQYGATLHLGTPRMGHYTEAMHISSMHMLRTLIPWKRKAATTQKDFRHKSVHTRKAGGC